LRVSGLPRTPRPLAAPGDRFHGLPRFPDPLAVPAMDFRVASNFASFRTAGFSDWPGRPVFLTSSAALSIQASGFPSSCISGFAGDGAPSRPEPRILRRCRLTDPQVALNSGPSVSPSTRSSGCPSARIVRLRQVVSQVALGLAPSGCVSGESSSLPEPLSSGIPSGEAPSCPGSSLLWFRRWSRLSGCPESQVLRRCR
jgi:hypothetical protein